MHDEIQKRLNTIAESHTCRTSNGEPCDFCFLLNVLNVKQAELDRTLATSRAIAKAADRMREHEKTLDAAIRRMRDFLRRAVVCCQSGSRSSELAEEILAELGRAGP